jgi:hypothetical protein
MALGLEGYVAHDGFRVGPLKGETGTVVDCTVAACRKARKEPFHCVLFDKHPASSVFSLTLRDLIVVEEEIPTEPLGPAGVDPISTYMKGE